MWSDFSLHNNNNSNNNNNNNAPIREGGRKKEKKKKRKKEKKKKRKKEKKSWHANRNDWHAHGLLYLADPERVRPRQALRAHAQAQPLSPFLLMIGVGMRQHERLEPACRSNEKRQKELRTTKINVDNDIDHKECGEKRAQRLCMTMIEKEEENERHAARHAHAAPIAI